MDKYIRIILFFKHILLNKNKKQLIILICYFTLNAARGISENRATLARVFENIWRQGFVEYDELEGIAWLWQAVDGSNIEAPQAQESIGPSSTDREKKWRSVNTL